MEYESTVRGRVSALQVVRTSATMVSGPLTHTPVLGNAFEIALSITAAKFQVTTTQAAC